MHRTRYGTRSKPSARAKKIRSAGSVDETAAGSVRRRESHVFSGRTEPPKGGNLVGRLLFAGIRSAPAQKRGGVAFLSIS